MCGIAGIANGANENQISQKTLEEMISILKHRGPDECGIYKDNHAGLGHARLSIIDIKTGAQPMSNEDKSVWITFNGEIFNYPELRENLIKKGHTFKSKSDTEVVIHLYEEHGVECLQYLIGQYAFAIWDKYKREMFLARDRLGIRPLYFTNFSGSLYFASEIKAIFTACDISREIDPKALNQIFTFWHPVSPRTAFTNIYELPPGNYLTYKNNEITIKQYWDLHYQNDIMDCSFAEASEILQEKLLESLKLQLRADVQIGYYLSGGLDSASVVALSQKLGSSNIKTFSVAFEDDEYDESSYQKILVDTLGTEHKEIRCSYEDISANFPEVIWHTEKPILRTAPAPLFLLSKLVRENNIKVVMSGDGADEVLGGYDIFKETKILEFWGKRPDSKCRPLLLKKLYPFLPAYQSQSKEYREAFFKKALDGSSDRFVSHRARWDMISKVKLLFSERIKSVINGESPEMDLSNMTPREFSNWKPINRAQYLELKYLLPEYILSSQGDRVAMAHAVECRFPFLDHRVVEFCARIPLHYKIKGLNEKYILKRLMKEYLPKKIIKRAKKPYLAPDSRSFFSNNKVPEYIYESLSEKNIKKYDYFKYKSVSHLVNKCMNKGVVGFKDNMAMVGILSTQILHKHFCDEFPRSGNVINNINVMR